MRPLTTATRTAAALTLVVATWATLAIGLGSAPASAEDDNPLGGVLTSPNVTHLGGFPSQVGISGCFLRTAPLLVTSGLDSVRVWDVSDAAHPQLTGVLPSAQFENEAMNCGERRTPDGIRRFALIGVDAVQASPGDPQHVNVGGGELIVVDVTDPAAPRIASRAPATTSTHTVTCVDATDCTFVYTAGDGGHFSILDLRDLDAPHEVDTDRGTPGVQPAASPTAGHKWNFDAAGIGTHTGWGGASMWDASRPARPRLLTTTGRAGRGTDPEHPGWNDFILHNSFRPNAQAFKPGSRPSFAHGNVLLATEEDYEQTDCTQAGSFQTWWVKRLDGRRGGIVPLDKVELADLGSYPLPQGAFCSSHWFDDRDGIVAVGFYGGGTQLIDARDPRHLEPFGHALWPGSEVWDAMWVPVYGADGRRTGATSNVVYSIDLVRGLDVYAVDVPGDGIGALPSSAAVPTRGTAARASDSVLPAGLLGLALALALAVRRRANRMPGATLGG
ncbi:MULTISPECIES: hypothetical protein [unclassified Nocardioides]|uniref:hypothetical protein n=1 Tax=unclassified Nocardioides TaxID=2615069 RepID=UPI00005715EA|nr:MULTISPECIES: hypothetical protein [unclassified Nocardioides]ABL82781.1 hypothetical protein Noca_3279 [Nocardioides sp. JS614]